MYNSGGVPPLQGDVAAKLSRAERESKLPKVKLLVGRGRGRLTAAHGKRPEKVFRRLPTGQRRR